MIKLVIADDEKLIREVLHTCIDWEQLGIQVSAVCKDGQEALQAIEAHKPDLVLTDIKMPVISGLELVEYFSKRREYTIEFLLLTAYEEFDFAMAAIKNHVHHYLVKPLKEELIIREVKKAVQDVEQRKAQKARMGEGGMDTRLYSECVRKVMDYVEQNYQDPELSLKQIADKQFYMNVDYLGRRFQEETGQRFNHYLTEIRISKAKYLLRHTNDSIHEIAGKIGYGNNPKYFGILFRKATGCTPLHYRQKKQKN